MASVTLKRVLVLHGYAQNGYILSKRLSALRKQCKTTVEFVFVDAPLVLQPEDLFDDEPTEPEANKDPLKDPSAIVRGWWKFADKERTVSVGLENSLGYLKGVLEAAVTEGKVFDGIFGFSQGAGMAGILAALLEDPSKRHPDFSTNGNPPHPPVSFCVCAAGFLPKFPAAASIISPTSGLNTLTLHICGMADQIIPIARANQLVAITPNKRIETHDGGHYVPSKTPWRKFIAAWLKDPTDTSIVSPEATADPGTADSNTSTPSIASSNTASPSPVPER